MMFPGTTVEELMSDKIYEFTQAKPIYLFLLELNRWHLSEEWAKNRWKLANPLVRSGVIWWHINEAWRAFGTINELLPIQWLAISKLTLQLDHVPSNLQPWAIGLLGRFDLARYQAAYHLPSEEYEAIARDLPEVLKVLREYPREKLAPPIDESNWGYCDQ